MGFFVIPQRWITPAITAAALTFGPISGGEPVRIHYFNFPNPGNAGTSKPNHIFLDKRSGTYWKKWRAQCVIVHQYGHLRNRKDSPKPTSIMHNPQTRESCLPYLRRHGMHR